MMDYFIPEDTETSDGAYHRQARQTMTEPIQTKDDTPFTKQEVQAALEKFDPRKAPGEDAINSEILLQVLSRFPTAFTECMPPKRQLPNLLETINCNTSNETGKRGVKRSKQI